MFKKIILGCLACVTLFSLTGCGEKQVEGTLEEIMTKVYADVPEDERPMMLTNTEVTEENVENYLGTKDIEYEEALASETAVGSIAHSVVLVRMKDGANVEDAKKKIEENANPRKWICVEAEDVVVKNKGNLIILIMSSSNYIEKIENSFDNL